MFHRKHHINHRSGKWKQRNELLVTNVTSIMKVHWKIWSKEINVLSQISHWLYKRIFWEIQTEEINVWSQISCKETNVWSQISHWLRKQIFWDSNQRNKCLTTNLTSIDNNFFLCFQIQNTLQFQTLPFFGDFATKPSWDPITKAHDKLINL